MSSPTPRHLVLAVLVCVLAGTAAVAAVAGGSRWSVAALALLVGAACLLLLDLRRRQQVEARSRRRLEDAVAQLSTAVAQLGTAVTGHLGELTATADGTAAVARRTVSLVERLGDSADAHHTETVRRLADLDHEPVNEVQALLQLLSKVPDAPPLPPLGGWALSAGSMLAVWDLIERERPATVVECGSGTSTLWLSYAARAVGGVRVISLEHKSVYLRRTEDLLVRHGVEQLADVRHARMREVDVDGQTLPWYDPGALDDVDSIDLLVVDGPPQSTGPLARFPAVPLLRDKLSPGVPVVLDDATRPGEREAVRLWAERYGVEVERSLSRDALLLRCVTPARPPA